MSDNTKFLPINGFFLRQKIWKIKTRLTRFEAGNGGMMRSWVLAKARQRPCLREQVLVNQEDVYSMELAVNNKAGQPAKFSRVRHGSQSIINLLGLTVVTEHVASDINTAGPAWGYAQLRKQC